MINNTIKMSIDCDFTVTAFLTAITELFLAGDDVRQICVQVFYPKVVEYIQEHYPHVKCVTIPTMTSDSWAVVGNHTVIWSPGA